MKKRPMDISNHARNYMQNKEQFHCDDVIIQKWWVHVFVHIVTRVAFKNKISLWWIPDTLKIHYENNGRNNADWTYTCTFGAVLVIGNQTDINSKRQKDIELISFNIVTDSSWIWFGPVDRSNRTKPMLERRRKKYIIKCTKNEW